MLSEQPSWRWKERKSQIRVLTIPLKAGSKETMVLHLWKHQLRKDKRAQPSQSLHIGLWIVNLSFHFWVTLFWAICLATSSSSNDDLECWNLCFNFLPLNYISKKIHNLLCYDKITKVVCQNVKVSCESLFLADDSPSGQHATVSEQVKFTAGQN